LESVTSPESGLRKIRIDNVVNDQEVAHRCHRRGGSRSKGKDPHAESGKEREIMYGFHCESGFGWV